MTVCQFAISGSTGCNFSKSVQALGICRIQNVKRIGFCIPFGFSKRSRFCIWTMVLQIGPVGGKGYHKRLATWRAQLLVHRDQTRSTHAFPGKVAYVCPPLSSKHVRFIHNEQTLFGVLCSVRRLSRGSRHRTRPWPAPTYVSTRTSRRSSSQTPFPSLFGWASWVRFLPSSESGSYIVSKRVYAVSTRAGVGTPSANGRLAKHSAPMMSRRRASSRCRWPSCGPFLLSPQQLESCTMECLAL